MMPPTATRRGFTLVELLTVIGIIAVLAALLFPVFALARGKAREITCTSNLRQCGLALRMYNQDHDGYFPWGVDATDRFTPQIWANHPEFQAQIASMAMIHELLAPYAKSAGIFRCPADTGYTTEDFTGYPLDATPTSFGRFGSSYLYRTELTFRQMNEDALRAATEVNVMFDGAGRWHGSIVPPNQRYVVLHADGHVKALSRSQIDVLWAATL